MNNEHKNSPSKDGGIEQQLWSYIDGHSTIGEKSAVEKLLESNLEWKTKYHELLEVHQLLKSSELEQPSLRFTKNVMEEISRLYITPATKTYINKKIIWGIAAFFIITIVGFLIYGFGQIDWNAKGDNTLPVNFNKLDLSKIFNNNFVNVFMMVNVLLALMLLDRFLANRRKNFHKEA